MKHLFINSQHPVSHRLAVLEDDGTSAWLYLTEANSQKPFADAWIYNRIAAPSTKEISAFRDGHRLLPSDTRQKLHCANLRLRTNGRLPGPQMANRSLQ